MESRMRAVLDSLRVAVLVTAVGAGGVFAGPAVHRDRDPADPASIHGPADPASIHGPVAGARVVPAQAVQADPAVTALGVALQIARLMEVLAAEGRAYGADLQRELFPDGGGPRWDAAVARIHDPARMGALFLDHMAQGYAARPGMAAAARAFFAADPGARFVALELAAREALLDPAAKEAAERAHEAMKAAGDPRLDLIARFVAANDLIESNVVGGMNANLAFYRGMIDGGLDDPALDEGAMMADLWGQEDQVRADTEAWLFPYLALAYAPASDADLEAYIAFSLTPEGRALNTVLFAAFDALFVRLSYELGVAAALFLQGQDL
jgi:hypothetical protein